MAKSYANYAIKVIDRKSHDYNGCEVQLSRAENGIVYVNLTEVAKAFPNKNLTQIINSQEIKDYCESLSKLQNYSLADLLIVKRGGNDNGTWAHQKVALRVAQKLSSEFAVKVDTWIEELLTTGHTQLKPLTQGQMLVQMAQAYELQERMILEQQAKQRLMETKIHKLECVTDVNYGFMAVLGYAKLHGININRKEAAKIGKAVSSYCRNNKIEYGSQKHPIFGNVNIYPDHALQAVFPKFYPQISF